MTPNQPQNFEENLDAESFEDKLIRAYISINRSKLINLETFKES